MADCRLALMSEGQKEGFLGRDLITCIIPSYISNAFL